MSTFSLEHTAYILALMIPSYYAGRYLGYQDGRLHGIADAIEYFMKNNFFTPEKEQEIKNVNSNINRFDKS
jgi:hypothetical protein